MRIRYPQFTTAVFCKDKDDFINIMKINFDNLDNKCKKIQYTYRKYVFLKDDTEYTYIIILTPYSACSWSFQDFIITDNFKDNLQYKEIIQDAIPRFSNDEIREDFIDTVKHLIQS